MGLTPSPMEIAIIAIVALIVLGPNKLPEAARSVGKGLREMRDAFSGDSDEDDDLALDHHEDEDEDEDADDDDWAGGEPDADVVDSDGSSDSEQAVEEKTATPAAQAGDEA